MMHGPQARRESGSAKSGDHACEHFPRSLWRLVSLVNPLGTLASEHATTSLASALAQSIWHDREGARHNSTREWTRSIHLARSRGSTPPLHSRVHLCNPLGTFASEHATTPLASALVQSTWHAREGARHNSTRKCTRSIHLARSRGSTPQLHSRVHSHNPLGTFASEHATTPLASAHAQSTWHVREGARHHSTRECTCSLAL